MDPRDIQRSAIVFSKVVAGISNSDETPAKHRTSEQVKQLFMENGFEWYYKYAEQITLDEFISTGPPPCRRWRPL